MIERTAQKQILSAAQQLPVVALLGPRQSGKTTLARATFSNHTYVSLEDLDQRVIAQEDPRRFLEIYSNPYGIIIDEFQQVPSLLSYIQTIVDMEEKAGYFILTGSQNFLMNQAISQTLAGRIAIFTLLPCSTQELLGASLLPQTVEETVFKGSYPRIYAKKVDPTIFYPSYTLTYLERDVRNITNVTDLTTFKRFVQLCAGRIGQQLNIVSLASDCGISAPTAKAWLSLLEASYIIFLLQPHYKNFNKRLVKTPKLYFYDTGLACSLLEIESTEQLNTHYMRGALIECLVIANLLKHYFHHGKQPRVYFWRDNHGHEVDCLIEMKQKLVPIEIKSSKTYSIHYFDGLLYWHNLAQDEAGCLYVVYSGDQTISLSIGKVLSWMDTDAIFE